uniref:Uncharacterized protein n=1 Tax=Pan paniscus TaxID=9597 RepID=A0A2R9ABN0_PANPA
EVVEKNLPVKGKRQVLLCSGMARTTIIPILETGTGPQKCQDGASVPGADLPWSAWARRAHRPLGPRVRLRLRLGVSKGTCAASWGRGGPKASGQCGAAGGGWGAAGEGGAPRAGVPGPRVGGHQGGSGQVSDPKPRPLAAARSSSLLEGRPRLTGSSLSPWGGERECPWESRRAPPRVPSNPTRKRGPHSGLQQSPRPRPCLKSRPLHLSSSGPASSPVAKIAGLYNDSEPPRKTMRRGVLMTLLQQSAMTLPLWIGKPGDKPPPLCGANLASGDYVTRPGDK